VLTQHKKPSGELHVAVFESSWHSIEAAFTFMNDKNELTNIVGKKTHFMTLPP